MKNVLIYGFKHQAEQLRCYIENERCAKVAAFVADEGYKTCDTLCGLPVVTFEEALRKYPPEAAYAFAVSFAYQHMVHDRQEKLLKCKQAGYPLFSFISKYATVFSDVIGEGNIIYPGCHIAYGVEIGSGNFLETGVTIAHHTHIGNWNFFAPAATVCGDVTIGENDFFGANSTVMNSAVIGREVLVGAGAVVGSCPDGSVHFPGRSSQWDGRSMDMKI